MPPRAKGKGKKAKQPSPIPIEPDQDPGYQGKGRLPTPAPTERSTRSRAKAVPSPPQEEPPAPGPLPAIVEEDEVLTSAEGPGDDFGYDVPDTRGYGNTAPPDNEDNYSIPSDNKASSSSEDDNEDDSFQILSEQDSIPAKKQSLIKPASASKLNLASSGRGRGRPPVVSTATSRTELFVVLFMLHIGGVSQLFSFESSASIQDLRDKAADLLKKRHHELQLLYTTIWGKQTDKFALNDKGDWERMIAFVAKNRGAKKGSQYQVEIHDGVNGKSSTSKATSGSASTSELNAGPPTDDKATNKLASIQQSHLCSVHGFECFIIKSRIYEPRFKLGTHQRIPVEVLLEWADDCASVPPKASTNTVPEKYIPRILGIVVESDEDDEDGLSGLKLPETKPRGRSGPNPKNTVPVDPPAPSTWPPFPYPYPMLPPYAQQYPMPLPPNTMYPAPPASPVRMPTNGPGPRLRDWLLSLDEGAESDEESFGDLLNALKSAGVHRLRDFQYWTATELSENVKCSLGMAKRLISDAKHALRGQ